MQRNSQSVKADGGVRLKRRSGTRFGLTYSNAVLRKLLSSVTVYPTRVEKSYWARNRSPHVFARSKETFRRETYSCTAELEGAGREQLVRVAKVRSVLVPEVEFTWVKTESLQR